MTYRLFWVEGGIKTTWSQSLIAVAFTIIVSLVMGHFCFSTSWIPWVVYRSYCHHDTGSYLNTQAFTVQPGTYSLLGWESAHSGEVPCPRAQRHTAAAKTSRSKSQAIATVPRRPACIWSICSDIIGTLKLITAVLCGSSRPTQCQWDGTAIYVVMRATRDTQSPLLKSEK